MQPYFDAYEAEEAGKRTEEDRYSFGCVLWDAGNEEDERVEERAEEKQKKEKTSSLGRGSRRPVDR